MKTTFIWLRFVWISILLIWMSGCAEKTVVISRSRLMMGHVPVNILIKTGSEKKKKAIEATETAYQVAENIEMKISEYQPDSDISCLNRRAGKESCSISQETYEILKQSIEIGQKTGFAFDIRFASLSKIGRNGPIQIHPKNAFLTDSNTRIGVSAIGKGFIINAMIESLKRDGFDQLLIDGGGDIQASGGPWKVAIQIPSGKPGQNSPSFEIENQALATSGNYEQAGNVRNPKTLQKVVRSSSVSVIAPTLTLANALTTAFYVMGEEESILYLGKFPGIKIYWADPSGKIRVYPLEKK